jgi:Phosphotransferase enzyme family
LAGNPLLIGPPAGSSRVLSLPRDSELPQLARVLDGASVARWLREAGVDGDVEARPRYVRYKPRNKAMVLYDVRLDERWTQAVVTVAGRRDLRKVLGRPETRDLVERVRRRTAVSQPVMFLNEPQALVEWFPANRLLPGLAVDPDELLVRLRAGGWEIADSTQPELLTYKPERRAVSRWDSVIMKTYARREDFEQASAGLALSTRIPGALAPSLVGSYPDALITVQRRIPGAHLDDEPRTRARLGTALAALHRSAARPAWHMAAADHLEVARRTADQIAFLVPIVQEEVRDLLGHLHETLPRGERSVPSHGDFHGDQALLSSGEIALIDFDHACRAAPALDPATHAAHLCAGLDGDRSRALAALEQLLSGYGAPPANLSWYLAVAVLRRAAFPFRFLTEDWPERVRGMVRDARAFVSTVELTHR